VTRQTILTCQDVPNKYATSWKQVVVMDFDTTQQTQLETCGPVAELLYGVAMGKLT